MGSARISLIRGTSKIYEIDITDEDGNPTPPSVLRDATAAFNMRVLATDPSNVLGFTTAANPTSLAFARSALQLTFAVDDTASLAIQLYVWQLVLTLANGQCYDVVEWSPFDLNLGGVTTETPPVFDNTVKLDQDYQLPGSLQYQTAGGSPIHEAQVRVYYKSDYDAGRLTTPVGITTTKRDGGWQDAVLVKPGSSYVIQFFKPNEYGPDISTIIA